MYGGALQCANEDIARATLHTSLSDKQVTFILLITTTNTVVDEPCTCIEQSSTASRDNLEHFYLPNLSHYSL